MEEMIEEELKILQTQHPNRFDYLKLELQSFISLLQSQLLVDSLPSTSTATTQASTSMKRKRVNMKRRREYETWENEEESEIEKAKKVSRKRDRVDVVLDKAQACLRKIQDFKFSFIC